MLENQIQQYAVDNIVDLFQLLNERVKLFIQGKEIYLWQDRKGNICYSFSLLEKEFYTTTSSKLGNVLSSYFQYNIEVVKTINDAYKKMTNSMQGLNKAIVEEEKFRDYQEYKSSGNMHQNQLLPHPVSTQNSLSWNNNQNLMMHQRNLHSNIIELSLYQLENNNNTYYIYMNEIVLVHNQLFRPYCKNMFFHKDDLNILKNTYMPSSYMLFSILPWKIDDVKPSFILEFIYYMANEDINLAIILFTFIASCFHLRGKNETVVLYAKDDIFMKLFYEEIITPLMNKDFCIQIKNDDFHEKSLLNLNEKVIYNFHNILTATILDEKTHDLTSKLVYKDSIKIKNKEITTLGSILITSTSKYIPMISPDVRHFMYTVASDLNEFCRYKNIEHNSYQIGELIKKDLDNFSMILRKLDIDRLIKDFPNYYKNSSMKRDDILDGSVSALKVFERSIKNKDSSLFQQLKIKKELLYNKLLSDFEKNRVDRKNLIHYFQSVFGFDLYKTNRELISDLKYISNKDEPFDTTTFNNNGSVYYRLRSISEIKKEADVLDQIIIAIR